VVTSAGKASHSATPYFDGASTENSETGKGSESLGNWDDCQEGI